MRVEIKKVHETSEFRCSPATVFSVLCSKDSYEEWYGWPKRVVLSSVDPGFAVGARLKFRSFANSKIITSFEPGRRLTLDDQLVEEDFIIEPTVTGCVVTYTITLYDEASPIADKLRGVALETLRALKQFTYSVEPVEGHEILRPEEKRQNFFLRLLRGYTSPVGSSARAAGDTVTESAAALSARRLTIGAVLFLLLLAAVSFALKFEVGDIVASSGLSVHESASVNKQTAKMIGFGVNKDRLEVTINCQGRAQGGNYLYYSNADTESGEAAEMMIIAYDSYGTTRSLVYVDAVAASMPYSGCYCDLSAISPYGSVEDVEQVVGAEASMFLRDKSGKTRICFGPIDITADLFSDSIRAALVVVMDPASDVSYYEYYGPAVVDNPLPAELTRRQLRQVSTVEEYGKDLAAAERALVLPGKTVEQLQHILRSPAVLQPGTTEEGFDSYLVNCTDPKGAVRYSYLVSVFENVVVEVKFENLGLTSSEREFIGGIEASEIATAEDLSSLQQNIEILPSCIEADESSVILGYGHPRGSGDADGYPLVVKLWAGTKTVLGFRLMEG